MGSLEPLSPWILEDDFQLMKAIEAGASLESLAKGAVAFSRKFTLAELRDRWHSLLYDPVVSSVAASRISEVQCSSVPSLLDERMSFTPKGNTERVRSRYSTARKRLRMEPFDPTGDLNYIVVPNNGDDMGNAEDPSFGQGLLDDDILDNLDFDESFMEIINNAFPDVLEDIQQDNSMDFLQTEECGNEVRGDLPQKLSFVGNGSLFDDQMVNQPSQIGEVGAQIGNVFSEFGSDQVFLSASPVCGPSPACGKDPSEDDQHSVSLLHIASEDMDLQARDHIDDKIRETSECALQSTEPDDPMLDIARYIDELSKSLLNEEDPLRDKDDNGRNTVCMTEQVEISVTPQCCRDGSGGAICIEVNDFEASCVNVTSSPAWDPHPEYRDGLIICLLNRESDEIPDNDHIPLEPQNPKARKSPPASATEFLVNKKFGMPPLPPQRSKSRANNMEIDRTLPTCNSSGNRNIESVRAACKSTGFPSSSFQNEAIEMEKPTSGSCLNHPHDGTCDGKLEEDTLQDEETQDADMDMNPSTMEPEDDLIESDDDLPCFSDMEAMILDMDLVPTGQDLYQLEVARYQQEGAEREIIRMEQGASSYMQRELASRGALAVLYGRQSKYYIKKAEVLLGRATGEYPIDIDLGRSGTKTKVSRRQALISLKNDGSFDIKNLGTFPMSINGEELEHGKVLKLKNNSLIEIRGMAFVFETSKTCVRRYLDSISMRSTAAN